MVRAAALAVADGDPADVEFQVAQFEADRFAGPDAGFEHESDQGLVTTVVQVVVGALVGVGAGEDQGA
jgi:hypothetical protein